MATPDKTEPRESPEPPELQRRAERLAGFVVYAATLAGMASLAFGFIAVLSGNWVASGPFFIAAAIAFGALANAILRE